MSAPNYSLFAIPAYLVVAMAPHACGVYFVTKHNNDKFDLPSPRSTNNRTMLEKSLSKEVYRKYERCRAAHDNMLENMAFMVGGILSGVIAKLDANLMNALCAVLLITRVIYAISYINITSHQWATMRTLWYL
jgi:uncharacterized MAPEG superfamily protein